ncbi:synaptopodin-2 [Xyrichtys novacula]|uniref:Synaptopodin-2 n=1 Tax=Xyrichtys novacula TaxID=13765 RepID=A0AAV1EUE6_XYRNO|nr:synaptopodin-2 [Xyrichtys novacula]
MEPEAEDLDHNDNSVPWSGSDGSQELCATESFGDSYYEDDGSDADYQSHPCSTHSHKFDNESPEPLQPRDWESAGEPQSLHELSGSEEEVSYHEDDDVYHSESREYIAESPHVQTSPKSLSPQPQRPDSEQRAGQISRPHSHSSSSSIGCAANMTLALTLAADQPLGAGNRQHSGTGNRRVESSEEGGSSEAPPASVVFGISDEGAEQAEKWNSESDRDLCRPDRHRARHTRLSHNESQSERQVKENKSKCKRLALLLTNAPNPQNKGALLFKKRRQRVEKYTLVSYGTGENKFDGDDQIEEETEDVRSAEYNFEATSESEFEEEYSVQHHQHNLSLNWGSLREMEALPETKGKGALMFTQRRKRMDQMVSEQEELRSKALPVGRSTEPEPIEAQDIYDPKETYMHTDPASYMDENFKQHVGYQDNIEQMNHMSNMSRPLVPNRTAKPFHGFQDGTTAPVMPGGIVPATKMQESRFRVPVPINTNPHVWSPTGDIIASRDERISVPAIKTGILPEPKRRGPNKQPAKQQQGSRFENKGDRKSYIEPEEDLFSLGAEACNFMQPRTVKLKNPPPVAPKPTINPNCPPWIKGSPTCEPYIPSRSPVLQPAHSPVGPHSQHYLQQQDWAQPQQMANHWAPDHTQATLQTPASAWGPVNTASQLYLQPTTNSRSQQQQRSPVSMQSRSPTYSPHQAPSPLRNKSNSVPQSVASCPPQAGMTHSHESKASMASPKGQVPDRGINQAHDGPPMKGKGAELFAKRQSRMQKFVVDAETVQANKARSTSPTSSLPNYWRYSSNVRAPPPISYNPLLAPFYPPSAAKQPTSTGPTTKPKTKEKPKAPPKHLNALDIMKHQPYQLDSSLFKYDAVAEAEAEARSPSPSPKPTRPSKFEAIKSRKERAARSQSPQKASELAVQSKAEASKSPVLVSSQSSSARKTTRSAEPLATDELLDAKHTVTAPHITREQSPSARPASAASQQSSISDSIAAAFSPASLIARGVRQMAPRPKFSAKKPAVMGPQWKPVALLH